ncbi:hypothetical protein [Kitasatospora sp. NPDC058046]|uniref:hypothetical protein n=1 Tax=Kitasatospora sp. NPDC058046 TaxID=3346312 RepID=UPI0036DD2A31
MSIAAYCVLKEAAALLPLMTVWEQREAARAAGAAVRDVAGDVGRVAGRLRHRLATATSIASPYGWLVRIGLRHASDCGRAECESMIDVVTGLECVACRYLVEGAISRSWHTTNAADRQAEPPSAGPIACEATALAGREIRKARSEAARLAVPCVDCGAPGAAGLCAGCSQGRAIKAGISECIDLALAARADLADYSSVRTVWDEARSEIRRTRAEARHGTQDEEIAGASELLAIACTRDQYHQDALHRLKQSPAVVAESHNVYTAVMRSKHRFDSSAAARQSAMTNAATAADRAARFLLHQRVTAVARIRAGIADRSGDRHLSRPATPVGGA